MHFLFRKVASKCGCEISRRSRPNAILRNFSLANPVESEPATETSSKLTAPNVLQHPDYFEVRKLFNVEDLFRARVHLGHKEGSLDERMKPYIFGSRLGHLVFDLDKTAELLGAALNVAAHIAYRDGIILFAGQTPHLVNLIERTALDVKEFAHTRKWRLGMLTNSTMMFGALTRLPDLIILVNTLTSVLEQHPIVNEAAKMAIPVIGIVDTNCNPNLITYPVPGNDDTPCTVELYCSLFKAAILKGKQIRAEHAKLMQGEGS